MSTFKLISRHLLGYVILGLIPYFGWSLIVPWTIIGPDIIILCYENKSSNQINLKSDIEKSKSV